MEDISKKSAEQEYLDLINSNNFRETLNYLNNGLKDSLEQNNYNPVLIGNLFYDHQQEIPPFYKSPLLKDCEQKRIRLFEAAKVSNVMFEIGLNGGHSGFLALMSNKNIRLYANDIAEFYPSIPACHPEIYVQKASSILTEKFGDRFSFIKGCCLHKVPEFVKNNLELEIDLVHIDGSKPNYKNDFFNIMPLLSHNALVIFDDSDIDYVQTLMNELISKKYLYRSIDFPLMSNDIKYRNEILVYKKPTK